MKILLINNCHYARGGADIVYLNTGRLLERKGHEVCYFSQHDDRNYATPCAEYFIKNTNFFQLSFLKRFLLIPRFFYSFESARNLTRLIHDNKPDLAHVHLYKGTLTPSILVSLRKKKIPVVITLHDFGMICPHNLFLNGKNELCTKCKTSTFLNCIIHKCNRNNLLLSTLSAIEYGFHKYFFPFRKYFTRIITVSDFSYRMHLDLKHISNRLIRLYNFYPSGEQNKNDNQRGSYFLVFGRLSGEKGVVTFLQAWKHLQLENKRVIIAGTGPQEGEIKTLISEEQIQGVELVGFKKGYELQQLIERCSFVVVPSGCYENNPMSIVEAFSHGKPVIGSDLGGIPELIHNSGFVFTYGNQEQLIGLLMMASQLPDEEYNSLASNAKKIAKISFDEENHYIDLLKIYKDAILEKYI